MEKPKKVDWTIPAKDDLMRILEFIEDTSGFDKADAVIDKIIATTDLLMTFPELGAIEFEMSNRVVTFRYLIEGSYKIIYHANQQIIYVDYVFDTRQNPKNLK